MMEGVPHLNAHDLRADLEEAYRRKRQHHLFAYFGTGDEQMLKLANVGDFHVVPVRSELELRERLPDLAEDDVRMAFLVPWTDDIPLDISGRFALNGRVRRIGKDARLRHLFAVGEVEGDALRSPLVGYLLRPGNTGRYPIGDSRLTADAMWDTWLARDWSVPTEGGLALDTLLGWAAVDKRGARFAEAMKAEEARGVRDALIEHLSVRTGPTGPIIWAAWEESRGATVLELAILFETLAESPLAAVRMWVKTRVREVLGVEDEAKVLEVARSLGREAPSALRYVERSAGAPDARSIAKAADDRVKDEEVRAALIESTRLPAAWAQRLDAVGDVLLRASSEPNAELLEEATQALRALEGHVCFKDEEQRQPLQRAEMAVRLLAWLVARPDQALEPSPTPYGDAEELGRWYAEQGGYVDWARRWARGTADSKLTKGVQAIVRAADEARVELDRRFAKSLVGWVEAGLPSHQVLPIQNAVQRLATKFLDEEPERRLLVLLMDGMAWAQAVELLESLGSRAAPWGPLAWHSTKAGRVGEALYPVVFAGLPTVTEVSRSAFFAGKLMKPGSRLDTSKDPDKWAANSAVKKYAEGTDTPRLLLRSEGHTKGGSASQEALSLVGDPSRRVVAMVVNAIDDSLKASHAVRHPWRVESIASLPDLLEKAREHGRAVLLASDHGHVPADRIERVKDPHPGAKKSGGGTRWRPLPKADSPVADNEVAFVGSKVYTPKGAHGIVLLSDDASAYAGNTHAGEHGGATLAEVVAPCLIVGCEESATASLSNDDGLGVRAAFVPRWWHFDVREEVVDLDSEVAPEPPKKPKKPKDDRQLGLPIAPKKPKTIPPAPLSAFSSSDVLAARVPAAAARAEVVVAVETLLARQGVMSASAFAAEMKVLPFRVGGFISKLQEVLNLDGYEVVRYDPAARQVHLDREKLAQLFEVKL
ncbi:MAG TPA: BREX-2 system phosphatase PglZ [Polyangiaceae bacterium LLY-WYZ-15_(1-7)]|nr:BREX-2 system phosphatase PglZ [Polyangiaceae bacterium LLY-WYZ-15_(1-7)]